MLTKPFEALILWYQRRISPHMGHNCRFVPTCSEYMLGALRTHGLCKGLLIGLWRLCRCNPYCRWGVDPVPPKGRWVSPDRRLQR